MQPSTSRQSEPVTLRVTGSFTGLFAGFFVTGYFTNKQLVVVYCLSVLQPSTSRQSEPATRRPTRQSAGPSKRKSNESSDEDDVNNETICDDNSDDDMKDEGARDTKSRPVRRGAADNKSALDNCVMCGEFGKDNELWYRCRECAMWAHCACTSADSAKTYVCDYCVDGI